MLSPELKEIAEKKQGIARVIWIAFSLSIIVLIGLALAMRPAPQPPPDPLFVIGLICFALFDSLIAYFFYRYRVSRRFIRMRLAGKLPLDETRAGLKGALAEERLKLLSDGDVRLTAFLNIYTAMLIVNLALNESIAIIGFAASYAAFHPRAITFFGIISLLLNMLMFPKYEEVLERAGPLAPAKDA